ncbi:MAG: sugar phosphate isomerase/epimerase family protein [Thermodesulfobacteriota bacterium]|nr:sugar phosphate isomerase/epimerase family protein [Thermodesulfobacteriota bacterium]
MKYSFSSNAFRQYSLAETVCTLSATGYAGIEIMCDTPHAYPPDLSVSDIRTIKEDLARSGLTISNLNAFMLCAIENFHHPSWIEEDKDYRELRIQYTLACIDLAAKLGVRTISTEPGGPVHGMSRDTALDLFMDGLSRVVPRALENGVYILIEPEPGLLIETSHEFLSFIKQFGHQGIGLNFDIGHFYCVGEDPAVKIVELKDYIFHFHLEDIPKSRKHQHVLLGEGGIDIPKVLETIEMIGYQGFVTVELYPYLDSAPEIARKAHDYLRNICRYGYTQ